MWQRKQTIYLLLITICLIVMQVLPIAVAKPTSMGLPTQLYSLLSYNMNDATTQIEMPACLLGVVAVLVAVIAFATIFMFNNRKLQMTLCRLGQLILVLWVAGYAAIVKLMLTGSVKVQFAACLPVVCIILYELAYRGVKHDEELVRSADRIR